MRDRKDKGQIIFRSIAFVVIGCILFWGIQNILVPDYEYPKHGNECYTMEGFYGLENNELDVVFLGTSHMRYAVSPPELYEKEGIVSYNLAVGSQPIEMTYYLLQDVFKRQSPKVVVLDASDLFAEKEYKIRKYRWLLDNMEFSRIKVAAAVEYAKQEGDNAQQCFNSIFVPMIQFHDRWKEISKKDFFSLEEYNTEYITRGYALSTVNTSYGKKIFNPEEINALVDYDRKNTSYNVELGKEADKWVKKIRTLCDENSAELLLVKVPVGADYMFYEGAWNKEKSQIIRDLADKNKVTFLDFMYDVDLDIDAEKDWHDTGWHLNMRGTTKLSEYIGGYLTENYELRKQRSADMDADLPIYNRMREMAMLQTENMFSGYCELLNEKKEKYIVAMVSQGDLHEFLSRENSDALKSLGVQTDFEKDTELRNAYVALIDAGEVDYEALSNRNIYATRNISEECSIILISAGNCSDSSSMIQLNGLNLAKNAMGLQVVVLDKETYAVVDTAVFDLNGKKLHDSFMEEWQCLQDYLEIVQSEER